MRLVDSLPRDVDEHEDQAEDMSYRIVPECVDVVRTVVLVLQTALLESRLLC